uniref:Uncharacterized protein n=1 Tax=Anguilla anguilla TaxID=7936 RepID=A0A0E9UKR8_ANGAN
MPRLSINIAESQQTLEMKSMLESSEASVFLGFQLVPCFSGHNSTSPTYASC